MTEPITVRRSVYPISIRPLALPAEHGGWGFVLEPVALALLVAPSWGGVMIGVAALAAFLARQPLQLAAGDWMRRRRFPRTLVCEKLVALDSAVMLLALAGAVTLTSPRVLLPVLLAAPLGITQFVLDLSKRGRGLTPELLGAVAAGATAAAIALAGHRTVLLAVTLWLLTMLRSVPTIVYVRAALGKGSRTATIVLHAAAAIVAIVLWQQHLAPVASIVAMAVLFVRALSVGRRVEVARRLGMRELAFGALTVLLIGIGYRFL